MKFLLTGVNGANQVVALDLEAPDEPGARALAAARGYSVLSLRRKGFGPLRLAGERFPTALFSVELLALLDAGLNVVEALQALAEKETKAAQRLVLEQLLESLHRGESFSRSLQAQPRHFSTLYVATVRASERTGDIKQALARYVAYQEEFDAVRRKLVAALLYPAILVVAGTLVLGFLLLYVVPRFAGVYADAAIQLPFFSALLLAVGRWIGQNGVVTAVALGAALTASAYALTRERVRAALWKRLCRNPALGERVRVFQLGRFYRTVAMLLKAGIPAVRAFEMVRDLLPAHLRLALASALAALHEGKAISLALTDAGLATPVATRMLAVGERSGRMGEMMDRAARFCDDETARFIDAFVRVFEPLLMALLGLGVGAIVVLMYMPIFELAGSAR